jgi:hypothetical protein
LERFALDAERPPLQKSFEEAQDAYNEANAALEKARGEYHHIYNRVADANRGIRDAQRKLDALKAEQGQEERRDAAPVVKSLWQQNFGSPTDEAEQHTPGALRFGSANVSDVPLSRQSGEPQPTAVIPSKAIEEHGKRGK